MIYRLIALNGPLKGQRITIDPEPMTIGRDEACSIVLPDNEAALRHARVEQRGSELYITDLGAMNKVIVNKREVKESRLQHGDIIELGRTRLLVEANVTAEVYPLPGQAAPTQHRRARQHKALVGLAALLVAGATFALIHSGHEPVEEIPAEASIVSDVMIETDDVPPLAQTAAETAPVATAPAPAANAPIDAELKQIREDLLSIQQHIEQLNQSATILAEPAHQTAPAAESATDAEHAPPELTAAAIDEIGSVMVAVRSALEVQDYEQADLLLEHLQLEHPDYLPSYQVRAEMYENWGMPAKARDQWSAVLQRTTETDLYRKAVVERIRLGRIESQRLISAHEAVRILSIEQIRFRESNDYDEMRLVKVHLNYNRELGPIDPGGVRLMIYFFEKDLDTERVELSKLQPYKESRLDEMENPQIDNFTQTITYVVPKGYYQRDHNTSRQRYYGFIARLHYFDRLIDEQARPPKLLEPAILEAAGLALHTADSGQAQNLPASN